jgi:hypothetical protein
MDRPIKRCISCVLPPGLPLEDSRGTLDLHDRGIMPYSAVIQPFFMPFKNGGTVSSTLAVAMTFVSPNSMRQEPSAYLI